MRASSLLLLGGVSLYMEAAYLLVIIGAIATGILTLALQGFSVPWWGKIQTKLSLLLGAGAVLLFTGTLQPYAAIFAFVLFAVKVSLLIKRG